MSTLRWALRWVGLGGVQGSTWTCHEGHPAAWSCTWLMPSCWQRPAWRKLIPLATRSPSPPAPFIVQVTFVEAMPNIMPGFDREIAKLAQRLLINGRPIDYHTNVIASKVTPGA